MAVEITAEDVRTCLADAGLEQDVDRTQVLAAFLNLLEQWSRVYNLIGSRGRRELLARHLVESLALRTLLAGETVADVGTGAGLPGLPLAISEPGRRFTLIESRRKRVNFLRHVVATLGLDNVEVRRGRAEDLPITEPFATVLARAVAPPAELLEIVRPLTAEGSILLLLTSVQLKREIVRLAPDFVERPVTRAAGPKLPSVIVRLERVAPASGRA